jgi:TatD DNase family protein
MSAFDADRDEVLARASDEGVSLFVVVPSRVGDQEACARLAGSDDRIFATAGVHPHEARLWSEVGASDLRRALASPRTVAVGEIGLDFHYDLSPRPDQARAFAEQIAIARDARRPLVIHTRSARAATLDMLRTEGAREVGGVLHCFTEDAATASDLLDLGLHISFSGIATFPGASEIRDAARIVPLDRILVETDAPYLAPVPHRGRRNEPAFLPATIALLAQVRSEDPEQLARATYENCLRLFGLAPPASPTSTGP